jgi:hypothetical protein
MERKTNLILVFQPKGFDIRHELQKSCASSDGAGHVRNVNKDGDRNWNNANKRTGLSRPDSFLKNCRRNSVLQINGISYGGFLKNRPDKIIASAMIPCYKTKEFITSLTANRKKCGG